MTLRQYISINKLKDNIYIALYRADNKRFDGSFVNSQYLEPYLDMTVGDVLKQNFILSITIPEYTDALGIDYHKWIETHKTNINKKTVIPSLLELM